MTSARPYLLRALYDWIVANGCTPLIRIDAGVPGVNVPAQHVIEGTVVLNLSPRATDHLAIDDTGLRVNVRFGGVATSLQIPIRAVMSIYARENGQGMTFDGGAFPAADEPTPDPPAGSPAGGESGGRGSRLRVVK